MLPHIPSLGTSLLVALTFVAVPAITFAAPGTRSPSFKERKLYTGQNSSEAIMRFSHRVELKADSVPSLNEAKEQIQQQLDHLFGPMGEAQVKAVPLGKQRISAVEIQPKPRAKGTYLIRYSYRGIIVIEKGPTSAYDVVLPVNPDEIYAAGLVKKGRSTYNPCTDDHYQSEGDFWYFWNPARPGCQLQEGVDYDVISTEIKRSRNTVQTYPEYEKLADSEGRIVITMLFGMDEPAKGRNPLKSTDINADNYRQIRDSLIGLGYEPRTWSPEELKTVLPSQVRSKPFVEELVRPGKKATLVVRMFFGPSGINENSAGFHYFFKDALENSAVMIYDGHSGLGGHLDLAAIEETEGFAFRPNPNRYQIYFFNSCSSYTYYNTMYFARKKTPGDPAGTKNLDILTNGLATYFDVMHDTNLALIKAIQAWADERAYVSYQQLAQEIDSGNLFGVNGDEDNPTNVPAAPHAPARR